MPLSEHEERILAEIERQLAAEDPRFVARARKRKRSGRASRVLRLRVAVALAVVGFFLLLGLVSHIAFGAAGMTLLLAGIVLGATALRERADEPHVHVPPDERT